MQAKNIDEVIEILGRIIADAKKDRSTRGYFAALYRQVTVQVKNAIAAGKFQNGPRMERLDTTFANRYFAALKKYIDKNPNDPPSKCWNIAFNFENDRNITILQHLLLGMNAHINLDLGIASAELPANEFATLESDFNTINDVLKSLLDPVQEAVEEFSPCIKILDEVGGRTEETVINFGIDFARRDAWQFAAQLAGQSADQRQKTIYLVDNKTTLLGRMIAHPGHLLSRALDLVAHTESRDVEKITDRLGTVVPDR